jgi:hypothetical protein
MVVSNGEGLDDWPKKDKVVMIVVCKRKEAFKRFMAMGLMTVLR